MYLKYVGKPSEVQVCFNRASKTFRKKFHIRLYLKCNAWLKEPRVSEISNKYMNRAYIYMAYIWVQVH